MKKDNLHKALDLILEDFTPIEGEQSVDNPIDSYTPSKALVTSFIYGRERALLSCQNLSADIRSRLRYRLKEFDGSEVKNSQIENDTDMLDKLDVQEEVIQTQIASATDYFKGRFGHEYRAPTARKTEYKIVSENQQTEAYKRAQAHLNK